MYRETREPHDPACECDHCIADRRYEANTERYQEAVSLQREAIALGRVNNGLLSELLDELRAARLDWRGRRGG